MPYGFWVFAFGLILAIVGAAKPAPEVGLWPDTTIYFLFGAFFSGVGIVFWRRALRREVNAAIQQNSEVDQQNINSLFDQIQDKLGEYAVKFKHLNAEELHDLTEAFIDDFVTPIVEQRYELIHRFGMARGAEIALEFARGERLLNRVQTAALDGDLNEAHRSFPEARAAFDSAIAKIRDR